MKRKILLLIVLFCSIKVYATQDATPTYLDIVGISKDNKYIAFEQKSGFTDDENKLEVMSRNFSIVEIDTNKWAVKPISDNNKNFKSLKRKLINKYKIKKNSKLLNKFEREANDYYSYMNGGSPKKHKFITELLFSFNKKKTKLNLIESNAKHNKGTRELVEDYGFSDFQNKKFKLVLNYKKKNIVLQNDKKLPLSRGAVVKYSIGKVYTIENKIAVFIYCFGPKIRDARFCKIICVTGVVEK